MRPPSAKFTAQFRVENRLIKSIIAAMERCGDPAMLWYFVENGQQRGPVDEAALMAMARNGTLKPETLVWNPTMGQRWVKAGTITNLGQPAVGVSPGSLTTNSELAAKARASLAGKWNQAVLLVFIFVLFQFAMEWLPLPVNSIARMILNGPLFLGTAIYFLALGDGGPTSTEMLTAGFSRFSTALLAYFIVGIIGLLCALPGLIVMGIVCRGWIMDTLVALANRTLPAMPPEGFWIALAIIFVPSLYATLRFGMVFFVLADDATAGALDAISRGATLMKGRCWKLLCLWCRFAGWALLSLPTFGIGLLWLGPYFITSTANFYRDIKARGNN